MKKLVIPALLLAVTGLLAACGGDTATSTPVATTVPAVLDTSTPELATATTAIEEATATTGTEATTTTLGTEASTPTAGSATEPTTETTMTPGADATMTSGTSGGTSGGTSSGPALDEFTAVFDKMKSLTSYHESAVITSGAADAENTVNLEADVIPPDSSYITVTTTMSGTATSSEVITIGQDSWNKIAAAGISAGWVKSPTTIPMGDVFELSNLGGFQNVTNAGDDTLDGVAVTRYTFDSTASADQAGAASNSTGEAWVAKDSGYIVRMHVTSTVDVSGQSVPSEVTVNFSRFNDPSIKIEPPTTITP